MTQPAAGRRTGVTGRAEAVRLPADSDYRSFLPDVYRWESPAAFVEAPEWPPGCHVVMLPSGAHVDILLGGDPTQLAPDRCLPVVFSGAVTKRNRRPGPFYSGVGLGRSLETPYVAVSDPGLNLDDRLAVGWYTGRAGEDVQGHLARLLDAIAGRYRRELLLAGGSGGGFAALALGRLLQVRASALVWNPQHDLLDFTATRYLGDWLGLVLDLDADSVTRLPREERQQRLRSGGIVHSVLDDEGRAPGLRRLLYLQNASDDHVVEHLAPFLEAGRYRHEGGGRWRNPVGHFALVSAFGEGHDPPPRQAIVDGMRLMLDTSATPDGVVDELQQRRLLPHLQLQALPRDLRDEAAELQGRLTLQATREQTGCLRAGLLLDGRPTRYGGLTTTFTFVDEATGETLTPPAANNSVDVPAPGLAATRVTAAVHDGFGHRLTTLAAPLGTVAEQVGVFILGSCVSRDTFEFLDPALFRLRGYVARQSVVSAFGPAGRPPFATAQLSSSFQRRMLDGDARSDLPDVLRSAAEGVGLLVWDLVDERLGVIDQPDGTVTTDSVELRTAQLAGQAPADLARVAFGTPEHLTRFEAALPPFRALLQETGLLRRTVLLAPQWAVHTSSGGVSPASFGVDADTANRVTEAYVAAVTSVLGVPVVGREVESCSEPAHQWGPAPFHYDDATYLRLAAGLADAARSIAAPWGWPDSPAEALTRTPAPGERDPRLRVRPPQVTLVQTGPLEVQATVEAADARAVAFSLYEGSRQVELTRYVRALSHRFTLPGRGVYRCRVFVMNHAGERVPVSSDRLRVR